MKLLKSFLMRSKLKEMFENILILYSLNYDIKSINQWVKGDFESWDSLFDFLYTNHHSPSISIIQDAEFHYRQEKQIQNQFHLFFKSIAYSLMLIGISVLMIVFFMTTMLPNVKGISESFGIQDSSILGVTILFRFLLYSILTGLSFLIIGVVMYGKQKVWLWILLLKRSRYFKCLVSHLYISQMLVLRSFELEWNDVVLILKSCDRYWFVKWLTSHIYANLSEGSMLYESFSKELFDHDLNQMLLGCHTDGRFEDLLHQYLAISTQGLTILRKRLSGIIKTISYLFVACTIVGYYTVIMIPIRLMEVL